MVSISDELQLERVDNVGIVSFEFTLPGDRRRCFVFSGEPNAQVHDIDQLGAVLISDIHTRTGGEVLRADSVSGNLRERTPRNRHSR